MPRTQLFTSRLVGGIQCVLGGMASMFAYIVYVNADMQQILDIDERELGVIMLLLLVFGIFSIVSGAKLLGEER